MSWVLRYSNAYGERYYFCHLGGQWASRPALRLIESTNRDAKHPEVRRFATEAEAAETLAVAGSPAGYECVPVP